MKKVLLIVACLFIASTVVAQNTVLDIEASGTKIKDKRYIPDFDKIKVTGPFEVTLGTSDKNLIIEGSDNIVALITTEVKDGQLVIAFKDALTFKPSKNNKITIRVSFNTLNEISLYGSGSVNSNKKVTNAVKVKLNGSGSIALNLYCPKAEAILVGCGTITVKGYSQTFNCKLTGSGSVAALELESDIVDAYLSGSGVVKVLSNKAITGRINGSGTIAFSGEPQGQDLKRIGSGKFSSL